MWQNLDPHWALGLLVVLVCLAMIAAGRGADTVREVLMTMVGWLIGRSSGKRK